MMSVLERNNIMVNSINDSGNFKRIVTDNRNQRLEQPTSQSKVSNHTEPSEVDLSDTSQQIRILQKLAGEEVESRHAKVAYLRDRLNSGDYVPDSRNIATRMLAAINIS